MLERDERNDGFQVRYLLSSLSSRRHENSFLQIISTINAGKTFSPRMLGSSINGSDVDVLRRDPARRWLILGCSVLEAVLEL